MNAQMIESITALFSGLHTAYRTLNAINELIKGRKGDARAALEELKENVGLCWMVVEERTDPMRVIPELTVSEYDRLLKKDFDFNKLRKKKRKKKVRSSQRLAASDLAFLIGKDTAFLVEHVYDKIKDLKRSYRVDRENPRTRWRMRIFNLHKRMLLLTKHLQSR